MVRVECVDEADRKEGQLCSHQTVMYCTLVHFSSYRRPNIYVNIPFLDLHYLSNLR